VQGCPCKALNLNKLTKINNIAIQKIVATTNVIGRRGVRLTKSTGDAESFKCTIDQSGKCSSRKSLSFERKAHWNWPRRDPDLVNRESYARAPKGMGAPTRAGVGEFWSRLANSRIGNGLFDPTGVVAGSKTMVFADWLNLCSRQFSFISRIYNPRTGRWRFRWSDFPLVVFPMLATLSPAAKVIGTHFQSGALRKLEE